MLLQLGHVGTFDVKQATAALLYVAALAGLFAIRRFIAPSARGVLPGSAQTRGAEEDSVATL